MTDYFNARRAPQDLSSGRVLAPGETVKGKDLELGNGDDDLPTFDQRLVDSGVLVDAEPRQPEVGDLAGEDLEARARELNIKGRSSMNAETLRVAVAEAEAAAATDNANTSEVPQ